MEIRIKKDFALVGIDILQPNSLPVLSKSRNIFVANVNVEGLFSLLVQKLVSKVLKTEYFAFSAFCFLCPSPPPIGYADASDAKFWAALATAFVFNQSALSIKLRHCEYYVTALDTEIKHCNVIQHSYVILYYVPCAFRNL